ncbi:STY4528 family pathogenicity island replication protein [Pasteurella oralis]|uniref:STY4528 family pathogenicity island replication protein n=1 Tax=Pasteurella oralis TaxID=1071947 RepID=UPI00157DB4A2|nr:STY4528 family pathogenicity island replication protein [Pasteurella oralis]
MNFNESVQKTDELTHKKFINNFEQLKEKEKMAHSDFQSLLFIGNRHETVPVRLLTDPYLTPRAKTAWQLIKLNAVQFKGTLFPSYQQLSLWLSEKAYKNKPISRKLVSQTLLLLRLTRWLTLCETVRNEKGQILGNVYMMNDEPLSILDSITLNSDYLRLLEKTTKHKDPIVAQVANAIIDEVITSDQLWHFASHIDAIRERYNAHKNQTMFDTHIPKLPENLVDAINKTQQYLLSSNLEPCSKISELSEMKQSSNRELSYFSQSSQSELSKKNADKSLILGLVPNRNSAIQYSTSTYKDQYSTSTEHITNELDNFPLSHLEKQTISNMMGCLPEETRRAVIFEANARIKNGDIKKPAGYLFNLVKRAKNGEFTPYLMNKAQKKQESDHIHDHTQHRQNHHRSLLLETMNTSFNSQVDLTQIRELARKRVL